MSFRKRNLPLSATTASRNTLPEQPNQPEASDLKPEKTEVGSALLPGTRVSPLTGQPTTSTGTPSLDNLLGGHSGLPVGSSILIGENGTTDNAGALLRCYAAEGLAQDHVLHVVSVGREWIKGLPGLVGGTETEGLAGQDQNGVGSGEPERGSSQERSKAQERMKIAWRYERFAAQQESRASVAALDRQQPMPSGSHTLSSDASRSEPFSHTFDLTKRLELGAKAAIFYHEIDARGSSNWSSPFKQTLQSLAASVEASPPGKVHRIVIPGLLSPLQYPSCACQSHHLLPFIHALRALLRSTQHSVTAMISLPLSLYPRSTGLVRWTEILLDAVFELTPFSHNYDMGSGLSDLSRSGAATTNEETPQGMVKVHKLPISQGSGSTASLAKALGDDLAYTVSRRRFAIKPFFLPPAEGDTEAQRDAQAQNGKIAKERMEF